MKHQIYRIVLDVNISVQRTIIAEKIAQSLSASMSIVHEDICRRLLVDMFYRIHLVLIQATACGTQRVEP